MKKVFSVAIVLCVLMLVFSACTTALSAPQKNVESVLHLVLDAPNEELTALLFREDAVSQIGEGAPTTEGYESGYYDLLREKIGGFFTEEAYARFEKSDASGMYHFVTYVTGQTLHVEKISFEKPDQNGKMNFTVDVSYTPPSGQAQKEAITGFAVLENDMISDFYLGGTALHALNKTPWDPADVPVFPMP